MVYPPSLPPATRTNLTLSAGNHAADHNSIVAAIKSVVDVLGADPTGEYSDLSNRLLGVAAGQDQAALDAFRDAFDAVVALSGIDTTDDAVAALIGTVVGPNTQAALDQLYGGGQRLFVNGAYVARGTEAAIKWTGPARPSFTDPIAPAANGDRWVRPADHRVREIISLPGLTAYWTLDEGAGTTVHDYAKNPVDGTVSDYASTGAKLSTGWAQPGGRGAIGLRQGGTGRVSIPATTKLDLGDRFTFGVLFRRRSLKAGTVFQHGPSLYGPYGAELIANGGGELPISTTSPIGNWRSIGPAVDVTIDPTVKHSGASSIKTQIQAGNGINGAQQLIPSAPPGRYKYEWWGLDDAGNALGKNDLQVSYTPATGGAAKVLQTSLAWSTASASVVNGTHDSVQTLHTVIFDLPEAAGSGLNGLSFQQKRQGGAGGGNAYAFWIDDVSLKASQPVTGAWAIEQLATGALALKAPVTGSGVVTIASTPAGSDHNDWHLALFTKDGAAAAAYLDSATPVTIPGTNVTIGASGAIASSLFNGDAGQFDVVAAHAFVVNRAITGAEVGAILDNLNMFPDRAPERLRVGTNNFTMGSNMDALRAGYAAGLRSLRVTTSREALSWARVEFVQGTYTWTYADELVNRLTENGIEILPFFDFAPAWAYASVGGTNGRVVPTDVTLVKGLSVAAAGAKYIAWRNAWATFMAACVTRYKDRIHSWEVLNEMNAEIFMYPAASHLLYVDFYNYCRAAILAADPTAKVGIAGLARMRSEGGTTTSNAYLADEWLRALLDANIDPFDFVGAHPYTDNNTGARVHNTGGTSVDQMHRTHDTLIEYGRTSVDVQLNEVGWYTGVAYVAPASDGAQLPQATINVVDTTHLAASGVAYFRNAAGGVDAVTYTGKTGTTLTGCTGGTGVLVAGNGISFGFGSQPLTDVAQAGRIAECLKVAADSYSAWCSYVGIFSYNTGDAGVSTDPFAGCRLYETLDQTQPRKSVTLVADAFNPFKAQQQANAQRITVPVVAPVLAEEYEAVGGVWVRAR